MKKIHTLLAVASLLFAGNASAALVNAAVPSNAYITVAGFDVAWAAPCAAVQPSCGPVDLTFQSQFGWTLLSSSLFNQLGISANSFLGAGGNVDALTGNNLDEVSGATLAQNPFLGDIALAVPYFSSTHFHADWSDGAAGDWSFSDVNGDLTNESLVYRERVVRAPVPTTLALFGLGLVGLAWSKRKSHA